MAVTTTTSNLESGDIRIVSFAMTAASDVSPVIESAQWADRSVQIAGTYGTSTVTIEGSNDGTNYATLNDAQGNALSAINADKIEQMLEVTRYLRAKIVGGTSCSLAITFLLRRAQQLRV